MKNTTINTINLNDNGRNVDFAFSDGTKFRFHSLWLRDACRDEKYVTVIPGEKVLSATPASLNLNAGNCFAKKVHLEKNGKDLTIEWDIRDEHDKLNEKYTLSNFNADFLRGYANVAARPLTENTKAVSANEFSALNQEWLYPYTGFPEAKGHKPGTLTLWTNQGKSKMDKFPSYDYNKVLKDRNMHLDFLQSLVREGVVIVDNVPTPKPDELDESVLEHFTEKIVGRLSKDPARTKSHWRIAKIDNVEAQSISYNIDLRLMNHTDQSVTPYAVPGLIQPFHYIKGSGHSTLVDTFAVCQDLKNMDPKSFDLLRNNGQNQERDFIGSRIDDNTTTPEGSLWIETKVPIVQTDDEGNMYRTQYNEVWRSPMAGVGYDEFLDWYNAYLKFNAMIHSPEYEVTVPITEGQMILMDNWRVLHGRDSFQSQDRTVVGGIISREAFYSRARKLISSLSKQELEYK